MNAPGYFASPWPGEDGGPARLSTIAGHDIGAASVTFRDAVATTMVVLREPGEVFSLHHGVGPDAPSWVERIDAQSLATIDHSDDLAGGPVWPGGMAVHANGSLYVVFGAHAHKLDPQLRVLASRALPRVKPYNSFVILPDGHLVTKDFGGVLPGHDPAAHHAEPAELLVLEPDELRVVARTPLPEPSIPRLSAIDSTVVIVGTKSLFRAEWDGARLTVDDAFAGRYCTEPGQTYGWDAVLAMGAAWFLDNGFGSERYAGTFRGQGVNEAPLHLVRVDLDSGATQLTEICGLPNGVVANPPLIDVERRIAIGYDSGNGVVAGFDIDEHGVNAKRWTRDQNHACHPLLFADCGLVLTTDHDTARMSDELVLIDVARGEERARAASGSAVQSVLFPTPGWNNDAYYCSFAGIARLSS